MADDELNQTVESGSQGGQQPPAEPTPPPDYKGLYEQAQTALSKVNQQFKSLRGSTKKQLELDAEFQDLKEYIRKRDEREDALLQGLIEGDPAAAVDKVNLVKQRHKGDEAQNGVQREARAIWNKIGTQLRTAFDAAEGEESKVWQSHPDLQEIRDLAQEAQNRNDISLLREAKDKLGELAFETRLKREIGKAIKDAQKQADETVKETLEEKGVFGTPNPKAAGSSTPVLTMEKWKSMTPEERNNPVNLKRFRETFLGG